MNLESFDQKSTIIINSAFNYAAENNYVYFTPLHILEVMINANDDIKSLLNHFSVNYKNLYLESQKHSKKAKKKNEYEETFDSRKCYSANGTSTKRGKKNWL